MALADIHRVHGSLAYAILHDAIPATGASDDYAEIKGFEVAGIFADWDRNAATGLVVGLSVQIDDGSTWYTCCRNTAVPWTLDLGASDLKVSCSLGVVTGHDLFHFGCATAIRANLAVSGSPDTDNLKLGVLLRPSRIIHA